MRRFKVREYADYIFIILQVILYIIFLTFDITNSRLTLSNHIKFSMIIICFCYALFFGKSAYKGILFCLKAGLLFTVISDLFLLVLNDGYIYGILTFIIVQQLYGIRLILADLRAEDEKKKEEVIRDGTTEYVPGSKKERKERLLMEYDRRFFLQIMIASLVCFLLNMAGVTLDGLLIMSVIYFVCIVTNTLYAMKSAVHQPQVKGNVIFAVGMVLFLLCDINVGLFNMSGFIELPGNVYHTIYSVSSLLMWTFYAPSQVLIALSSTRMQSAEYTKI